MKNSKNKKYVLIVLMVVLFGLAIGYAAFSDGLSISGYAAANGRFDLAFISADVAQVHGASEDSYAQVSTDKNQMEVCIFDLSYPGAGAEISAAIKNVGTVPAKITNVIPDGLQGNPNIKIEGLDFFNVTNHPALAPGETCEFSFIVKWDPDSTTALTEQEIEGIDFNLYVEYSQEITPFDGTPSHIHH